MQGGHLELVRYLIARPGAYEDSEGGCLLKKAIRSGKLEMVRFVCEVMNAKLYCFVGLGPDTSALHDVILYANGNLDIFKYLWYLHEDNMFHYCATHPELRARIRSTSKEQVLATFWDLVADREDQVLNLDFCNVFWSDWVSSPMNTEGTGWQSEGDLRRWTAFQLATHFRYSELMGFMLERCRIEVTSFEELPLECLDDEYHIYPLYDPVEPL